MYQYADNPIQERHQEDPLINNSNSPLFGYELGQFTSGTNITYWIKVIDTANNFKTSGKKSYIIN